MSATKDRGLHYLFLDLETTGLDDYLDEIIEFGVIGTTIDLDPVFRFETPVTCSPFALNRMLNYEPVVVMHRANGLLEAIESGKDANGNRLPTLAETDAALAQLIGEYRSDHLIENNKQVALAGSGVSHFDNRFLKRHAPLVTKGIDYAPRDIGVLRRLFEEWTGSNLVDANTRKDHRAMRDAECHLEEAAGFRDLFLAASAAKNLSGSAQAASAAKATQLVDSRSLPTLTPENLGFLNPAKRSA